MRLRTLPAASLTLGGLISIGLVFVANDVTWRTVWIGLAATCLSAGLIDAASLLETRRRLRPVELLAAQRIGRLCQLVFQLIDVVFEGYRKEETDTHIASLRDRPEGELDLTLPANVYPSRSRAQRAVELRQELRDAQSECLAFAAAGVLGEEVEALDRAISSSPFITICGVATSAPRQRTSKVLSGYAADLLAAVEAPMTRAREAAGPTWKHGKPPF